VKDAHMITISKKDYEKEINFIQELKRDKKLNLFAQAIGFFL